MLGDGSVRAPCGVVSLEGSCQFSVSQRVKSTRHAPVLELSRPQEGLEPALKALESEGPGFKARFPHMGLRGSWAYNPTSLDRCSPICDVGMVTL